MHIVIRRGLKGIAKEVNDCKRKQRKKLEMKLLNTSGRKKSTVKTALQSYLKILV